MSERKFSGAVCKGSAVLGTACGKCARCRGEMITAGAGFVPLKVSPEHALVEMPATTHVIRCLKCDREMLVSMKTVAAICVGCSNEDYLNRR